MKGQRSHMNDPKHERDHELEVSDIRNDEVHHEEGDINVTPVYQFLGWLAVLMLLTYGLVYGIMKWNDSRNETASKVITHMPKSKMEQLPPEPRLQLAPGHTMHPLQEGIEYRDSVIRVLGAYGYVNKDAGLVHIPIDLAKDIMLRKGIAVRTEAMSTPAADMTPAFTSSGRTMVSRSHRTPGGTFTVTGGDLNVRQEKTAE